MSEAASSQEAIPLRLGTPQEFERVRRFLRDAGFEADRICRLLKIKDLGEFGEIRWNNVPLELASPPLRRCIELFIRGERTSERDFRAACGDDVFAAFLALGLIRQSRRNPEAVLSTVWLYPVGDLFLVSDRVTNVGGELPTIFENLVFPAVYWGTLQFVQLLPRTHGEVLDMCGGNGIAALNLSRTARTAVSADISPRAAFFAAFNAGLNDAPIESLDGDLYAPMAGRQFDLITAHPPYVPTIGKAITFRDGGDTGEDITRGIIKGLPDHLRPGGTAMICCLVRDTDETVEERARAWLGDAAQYFDVVFGVHKVSSIDQIIQGLSERFQQEGASEQAFRERFAAMKTRRFVQGALFFRRYSTPVLDQPVRINLAPDARAADLERLLAWRRHTRSANFKEWLFDSYPRFPARLRLTATHTVKEGRLAADEHMFALRAGFDSKLTVDGWIVPVLTQLDGHCTVRETYDRAAAAGRLPDGFVLEAYAGLISVMIGRGLLEVDIPDETRS